MNMWLVGGGAYAVALFYALALCKVAGSADSHGRGGASTTERHAGTGSYDADRGKEAGERVAAVRT